MSRLLVVEDEAKIAAVLQEYLQASGHEVAVLARGDAVLPWLQQHAADLLLLDLMLPGLDGLAVCRAVRAAGLPVAVIMLTARVEEVDRLLGLEAGADDYICKPFSPREVVARVKAVLRRSAQAQPPARGLEINEAAARVRLDGKDVALTAVELRLLATLAAHPGRIYSRDRLMAAMYPDERVVADRTVDSHVKKLRRKLQAVRPGAEFIGSVYGLGYRLEDG